MKKIITLVGAVGLVLIVGFTVLNCGGGSPSSVVRKLYTAFEKGDTKAINELMTPESAAMMIMFLEKIKGSVTEKGGIEKTEEKIDGNKAVVKTTYKDGSTDELNLVKVDGKWKVTIDK
jgi:ketosteroid isomerase-like protein